MVVVSLWVVEEDGDDPLQQSQQLLEQMMLMRSWCPLNSDKILLQMKMTVGG